MSASSDDIFQQAIASFQAGRLDEAEAHFKNLLGQQPNNVAALNILGIILTSLQKYSEAKRYLESALKINADSDATFYNYGVVLKALGRPLEALDQFSKALAINAGVAETWNNRGTVFNDLSRYDDAIKDFDKAISLQPNYSGAFCNRGRSLAELKRYDEAFSAYDKALSLKPDLPEAQIGRGNVFTGLKRYDEALFVYGEALALRPDFADGWNGRGNVYYELKRYDEAISDYNKSLALKPDFADAWNGRGNVFFSLERYDEACADYDKALTLKPDLAEAWLGRGNVFTNRKRYDEACVDYDKALALKPDLAEAWLGCGNVFADLKRFDEAFAAYDKALALRPGLADAWNGRGNVFFELQRYDEALSNYDKALALNPDLAAAWLGRGNVLGDLRHYDEAFVDYDKAFTLKSDLISAEGSRLHAKMHCCNWNSFDAECAHLISSVKKGNVNTAPFQFLAIPSSPADQLQSAKLWVSEKCPAADKQTWRGGRYNHDRIRVAYLSADFRQHAVSYLMAGMYECHDKSRFETTAISWGPDDHSDLRDRIKKSFDNFMDVRTESDAEIAGLVRSMEIDIAIDLMGFTQGSRTGIFARRPAPVQVNYLGYIGTMGAVYIDYIIADRIMIPKNQYDFYSEKVAVLPNSFQPNDRERRITDRKLTRAEAGLPQEGFVFCCFNNNYKITPDVFDIWMRILKQVGGSVLWLVGENPTMELNLRSEATARGVDAERLIFAPRLPLPEHQARLRLADLFLDTLPYNAGATASDALWAGLLVLTRIGDTLAGRMAASLLNAIGMAELVTTTPQEYETVAVRLATHPNQLAKIKRKLADNRLTTPLFDTKLYTKHIEAAYAAIYERHQAGLAPEHIYISD